ncbi:MAG TPA: RidA family protein [Candidatus Agrococcus pullicola]|uniref:RidA family protein n=1 Tax=Candidatus Agrococcus pullicola TaxID=2838429 RepID=A0A9D1YTC3_9MICO|nr:RidA family protein [Candidatus Agrococcus pullicola]
MTVELSTPDGMFQPVPYHHVSVATGSRFISVAGQIARDEHANKLAPGDLSGQLAHALRNTAKGLAGVGAGFSDVIRLRFYVTGWEPAMYADFMAGIESVVEELAIPQPLPPLSCIGVDYLFEPDVLVEVEAEALLD